MSRLSQIRGKNYTCIGTKITYRGVEMGEDVLLQNQYGDGLVEQLVSLPNDQYSQKGLLLRGGVCGVCMALLLLLLAFQNPSMSK
jgi:hypothetical protein